MSVISAGTTSTTAFKVTSDTTGTLQLKTGAASTTAIDISASQVVSFPATTTLDFTGSLLLGDGSATAPTLAHSGDTNTGIYFPGADQIAITTAGTQRFVVDSAGNAGLGVTPSAWGGGVFKVFQLGGGGSSISAVSGVDEQIQIISNGYYDGSNYKYVISAYSNRYVQNNGEHIWETAASGTAGNNITFTQAMTLDSGGNLGVGTSSPQTRLHVVGGSTTEVRVVSSGNLTSGGASFIRFGGSNSATSGYLGYGGTGSTYDVYNGLNGPMTFYTNGSERARFTAAGGFALGTTTDPGLGNMMLGGFSNTIYGYATTGSRSYIEMYNSSTGDMTLGVTFGTASIRFATGSSNTERARITSDGDFLIGKTAFGNTGGIGFIGNVSGLGFGRISLNSGYNAAANSITFDYSGTQVGYIQQTTTAVTYNSGSDRRLKENIAPADAAGAIIDAIEIVKHDWKIGGHTRYGVIAQDLHKVAPEAVAVGDDGDVVEQIWGVDYSKLVPMLVKELQSVRARLAALESK